MSSEKPNIAIIEFDTSHAECIYSQILFLKDDYKITILSNEKNIDSIPDIPFVAKIPLHLGNKKEIKNTSKWVKNYLLEKKIDKVIFNSGERKIYKFLRKFVFNRNISFWGILHNPPRLKTSLKQKLISKKLKGYFVLSDFIKDNIQTNNLTSTPVESTYLSFFNNKERTNNTIAKPKNETWIVIPGKVEAARRDYSFLLEFNTIPKHLKFVILGDINTPEGIRFKEALKHTDNFITFNGFIPDATFFEYINKADFILPLVHPNNKLFDKYLNYKITATYNWAYSFKATMLMEQSFSKNQEFHNTSYFYNFENNASFFDILDKEKKEYLDEKWSLEYQKNKYLNFLAQTI